MLRCFGWGIKGRLLVGGRGSIKGQYEPVNCHSISQAIKLHSAIFYVQDEWILTYIAIISCSPVNGWSHENLLNPFVRKSECKGFAVNPGDSTSCLREWCPLHINYFFSVWQRVVSPLLPDSWLLCESEINSVCWRFHAVQWLQILQCSPHLSRGGFLWHFSIV